MPNRRLNPLSVWSFVLSLLFFTFVSAVMGHFALRQIKKTGERGRGLALAAVIIGWIGTAVIAWAIAAPYSFAYFLASVANLIFSLF